MTMDIQRITLQTGSKTTLQGKTMLTSNYVNEALV